MTQSEINSALFDILMMRRGDAYHAAEVMRRAKGEKEMAKAPRDSVEHANIRLLIGTWEAIAIRVLATDDLKIPFFEVNPVGHMWDALESAIDVIREQTVTIPWKEQSKTIKLGKSYAKNFEALNALYRNWLAGRPEDYQTAALGGITAQFG